MQAIADVLGKQVKVEWSDAAERAMAELGSPLLVEMELYFSCMIRKAVRFSQRLPDRYFAAVTPRLTVCFKPVVTKACKVSEVEDAPPVEDFQMSKPEAFVPRQLFIDFRRGKWQGRFQM